MGCWLSFVVGFVDKLLLLFDFCLGVVLDVIIFLLKFLVNCSIVLWVVLLLIFVGGGFFMVGVGFGLGWEGLEKLFDFCWGEGFIFDVVGFLAIVGGEGGIVGVGLVLIVVVGGGFGFGVKVGGLLWLGGGVLLIGVVFGVDGLFIIKFIFIDWL